MCYSSRQLYKHLLQALLNISSVGTIMKIKRNFTHPKKGSSSKSPKREPKSDISDNTVYTNSS